MGTRGLKIRTLSGSRGEGHRGAGCAAEGNFLTIAPRAFLSRSLILTTRIHTRRWTHIRTHTENTHGCALCNHPRHPNRRSSTMSPLRSAQECLRVAAGSGFTQGGAAFGWKEAQLLRRELWKQLPHHPNAPETIRQLLSKKHTQIVLPTYCTESPRRRWESCINLVCCCSRPRRESWTKKQQQAGITTGETAVKERCCTERLEGERRRGPGVFTS